MRRQIAIVEIGARIHPAPAQREKSVVQIEQVGIVPIDEVARPIIEILHIGDIGQCHGRMLGAIELLRIEPFPPLPFAIGSG